MKSFSLYWRAYGGWTELIFSPYFNISWFMALLLYPLWQGGYRSGQYLEPEWISIAFSTLPSIIGFSLGSIAILVSLSGGKMLQALQDGEDNSLLMKISAAFFHFLLLQLLCLLFGLLVKAHYIPWLSYVGVLLLVYSLFSGVATAAILISVARLRNWVFEGEDDVG